MGLSDITSGLTDRFSGDGGEGGSSGDDDFLGDAGDLGEGFGDDFGGMDDWEEDDDFGGMDDWDDEGESLGGGGGGGGSLDPRIEELENEVASLSSTMGTVRSENEAIQESVEDIEDNIRKLLEIYEMVTRGVNPFVDEPQGGGGMGGSFGLFEEAGDDGLDDLDPDVADADPDSFFDDDFDDGGFEDDFEADDFADDAVEEDPFGGDILDADEPAADADASGDEDGSGGDGKTFDELKSEYQSGDGEWEDADLPEEPTGESQSDSATESVSEPEPAGTEGEPASGSVPDPGAAVDEALDDLTPADGSDASEGDGPDAEESTRRNDGESRDGKPYLESLPSGYGVELLVIEWLSYLRNQSSTSEALRAIKYYETIGWIGSPAANSLQRYLSGLTGEEADSAPGGGTQLTIDHHTNSLHYIGKIGGTDVDVKRLEWTGPARASGRVERRGQRGIQR